MKKIRSNDEVVVITGKDKGRRGRVLRVEGERVVVERVNKVRKAVRPNPQKSEKGGLLDREMSIHVSNVMLFNPKTQKGDRIAFKHLEDGKKMRYFKSNGEMLDQND